MFINAVVNEGTQYAGGWGGGGSFGTPPALHADGRLHGNNVDAVASQATPHVFLPPYTNTTHPPHRAPATPPTLCALCQRLARLDRTLLRRGHRHALLIQPAAQALQVKLWSKKRGWAGGALGDQPGRGSGGGSGAGGGEVCRLPPALLSLTILSASPITCSHPSKSFAPLWAAPPPPTQGPLRTAAGPWLVL